MIKLSPISWLGIVLGTGYSLLTTCTVSSGLLDGVADSIRFVSIGVLLAIPISVGVIMMVCASREEVLNWRNWMLKPWLSIVGWALVSLVMRWETLICVVMILPLYLPLASLGGFTGAWLRRNFCQRVSGGALMSSAILPLLLLPMEGVIGQAEDYITVVDSIEIEQAATVLWPQVLNIPGINPDELNSSFSHQIGIPKPEFALTPTAETGAMRQLGWEHGVRFQELITELEPPRYLAYDVLVDQASMKLAALDTHVTVGDRYFDDRPHFVAFR